MALGKLPRPTRGEAEQIAERMRDQWVHLTGKSKPIMGEEAWVDVIQTVFRHCADAIEGREVAE